MKLESLFPALTLPVLACAAPLSAQVAPDVAEQIRKEGIENTQVMAILDELTGKIGHRLTGSDNFTAACEWGKSKFESFGMEHVELEKWDTWPVVWNRGQWSGRVVEPEGLELQIATPAWTAGTRGRVRGPLLAMPKSLEELEELGEQLSGAYLFGSMPGGRRNRELGTAMAAAFEEYGVAGRVYSSSGDDQYPNRMRVFGSRTRDASKLPTVPEIMVRQDQAKRIEELLAADEPVVVEFDVRNRFRAEPIDLYNVIAEIRGTEKPDEIVVVCGHLDSWHQATGTTDNGTGTSTTLEAARILMAVGAKPLRTIRFCLWGGEEQGLLGSQKHTTMRRTSMDKISAVFNHDTGTNWAQNLTVTNAQFDAMEGVLAPVMKLTPPDPEWEGDVFDLNSRARLGGGGGSDHASFMRAGVPGFSWGLKGRSDYFRYTWHTQWDTFDVAIPEYQRHTATVVALTALGVANLPELLSREGVGRAQGDDAGMMIGGYLGAELDGVVVSSVDEDGRATTMGMKKGDKIVEVNGVKIEKLSDVMGGLRRRGDDAPAERTMVVERGEEQVVLKLPARRRRR